MNRKALSVCLLLLATTVAHAESVEPLNWPGSPIGPSPTIIVHPKEQKRGTAPGLSSVRVYLLKSDGRPTWEYPASGQIASNNDHSGYVYIGVYERGYGSNSPVVKFLGAVVSPSAKYSSQTICAEVGEIIYSCSPGQTVIGWLKYWKIGPTTGGSFSYSNTSLSGTSPTYGTKSFVFTIR